MKICIITPEIGGPATQEDFAIALTVLAETLAASGHDVTHDPLAESAPPCNLAHCGPRQAAACRGLEERLGRRR